jgi:hypothetical protein
MGETHTMGLYHLCPTQFPQQNINRVFISITRLKLTAPDRQQPELENSEMEHQLAAAIF